MAAKKKSFRSVKFSKRRLHSHLSNFHSICFEICNSPPLILANCAIVILSLKATIWEKSHAVIHRMHLVVRVITLSIRLGIEPIKLCTVSTGIDWNLLITRFLNCSNVYRRSCCCNTCLFSILTTMENTFSMTARSGDLARSLITVLSVRYIAARAEAKFWEGSPSCRNNQLHPLSAAANRWSKWLSINEAK